MNLQWWCSARGVGWEWEWTAYPGVWVAMALLIVLRRRLVTGAEDAPSTSRFGALAWGAGVVLLWVTLDWPLGALGAGYLASAHAVQFLAVGLVAPALLVAGLPRGALRGLAERPRLRAAGRWLGSPVAALAAYNAILVFTHLPAAVDTLRRSQAGSFAIDALWLAGGLILWWPVLERASGRRLPALAKMGYLFANTIVMGVISLFLVFGEWPLYGVYELAPRVAGITAGADQQAAGVIMKVGGMVVHWSAITAIFFRWYRREAVSPQASTAGPAPARP